MAQLIFSSIAIYRAGGSQLERYGYAAFGLSVFPYTLMSFVNLVVITIVGEYSTLFVLRMSVSGEAKRCSGRISGEIGTLPEVTQAADAIESPMEEDGSSIGMEICNDGEDRHVTPLPNRLQNRSEAAMEKMNIYWGKRTRRRQPVPRRRSGTLEVLEQAEKEQMYR